MSKWETDYRRAAARMMSPDELDQRILRQALTFKPPPGNSRIVSGAAGSFAAIAVMVLLIHPAQYLGALTPGGASQPDPLDNWQFERKKPPAVNTGQWFELRHEIRTGNYAGLCKQWRKEQRGQADKRLPRDLATEARQHCRILSRP